jgi:dihydrofolate reductase
MSKVIADMSMSLDGFVATQEDGVDEVFAWMGNMSEASGGRLQDAMENVGALITGRRTFDLAQGWGGKHPMGVPVFIVTHSAPSGYEDAPFTFVTDGVESAVEHAKAAAGGKWVGVASPDIAQQALNAGLLDGVEVSLVPVLLGRGVRFFDNLGQTPRHLDGPSIVEGNGVTHLSYTAR